MRVDEELLLESQLTGDRQLPHCVRGLDLDFLPLSSPGVASPGSDWPRDSGRAPRLDPEQCGPSTETCDRPSAPEETQERLIEQGADASEKSFSAIFERRCCVVVKDWDLESETWLQLSYGILRQSFALRFFFFLSTYTWMHISIIKNMNTKQ